MEDYSHVGYHRGDAFKWVGITLLILAVAAVLIALFSRVGMKTAGGDTNVPPDWPQLGYVVDSAATDVSFSPDIRTIGGAAMKVAEHTGKTGARREETLWQIMFNHPDPPEQLLKATDQQLTAAGWKSRGGRSMEHFAMTGLLDESWEDPSGEYKLLLRYWSRPPGSYGNASQPQHWHVMISKDPY
ncbi:hypothetical protein KDL44_09095 [bacterium]|nr:hypothetical protein [bacterium]